jgi:hypothetical protein
MIAMHFLVKGLFLTQVFLTPLSVELNDSKNFNEVAMCFAFPIDEAALGVWEYTMTKVKSPYTDGVLYITKQQDTYHVAIKFSNGILTGQDVIIRHNHINFNMNIAGLERVSFVLLVDGNRITGESYSKNGSSQIIGSRKYPES